MSRCCYARLASFGIDRVSLCFELKKPTHRYISHTSYQSMTVRMLSFNDALLLIALELWPSHVLLGFFQPARLNAVGGGPNQKRRKENERTTSKSERRPAHRAEEKAAKKLSCHSSCCGSAVCAEGSAFFLTEPLTARAEATAP